MNNAIKSIWIDLDNSPHVPLFAPLIRHYRENGVEIVLTARDHSQTIELLDILGFGGTYEIIGRHYGKSRINKIRGLLLRACGLASYLRKLKKSGTNVSVAVSHGSRSMVLAAKWLRIPIITMYDYEFTETRIFNRFSDRVLIADQIPDRTLDEIGVAKSKRFKYEGIKEELYLRYFQPVKDYRAKFLTEHGPTVSDNTILAVLRPPATTANYHADQSEILFHELLRYLLTDERTFTVIVPRTDEQAKAIERAIATIGVPDDRYFILEKAVDGLNLAYACDLLISGGGTMNREAALLGVPVYSIFSGKQGALDAQMEKEGSITFIREKEDIAKIVLQKRKRDDLESYSNALTDRVERFVIDQINSFLEKG